MQSSRLYPLGLGRVVVFLVVYIVLLSTMTQAFLNSESGSAALAALASVEESKKPRKRLIAVVTGSSTGIGKATSLLLAKESDRFIVYATMRSVQDWDGPVLENLRLVTLDVTSDESVSALMRTIEETEKRGVDILINNAGIGVAGCLELVEIQQAKDMFDINVWGSVRMMQAVLPSMRSRNYGYIINLSSTSGIRGVPCFEYYVGSKFALEGISDSMRYSIAPFNISVTNVHASIVKTAFASKIKETRGSRKPSPDPEDYKYLSFLTDRFVTSMTKRVEMADTQKVDEVAQVVVNLVHIKLTARKISDVPFNIGTNLASQRIIETVRKDPIGWGEISKNLLVNMPPVPERKADSHKGELCFEEAQSKPLTPSL